MYTPRALQILHAARDLRGHVYNLLEVEIHAVALPHVLEQRAVAHVFRNYKHRLADRAHAPQLHQLLVSELFHYLELFSKLLFARLLLLAVSLLLVVELERFYGHNESIAPQAFVDLAEVASANERAELDVDSVLFPNVLETNEAGYFGARFGERSAQAVGSSRVEGDQLVEAVEAVARRYEAAARVDFAYAVVLGVALLFVVVVEYGERPALAVVLFGFADQEHARLVV